MTPVSSETDHVSYYADELGFRVEDELDLLEWCNRTPREVHRECIHLIPEEDTRRLHVYRAVGEPGQNRRLKTTLENVRVNKNGRARYWCLHGAEATTVISFLNLMAKERADPRLSIRYYADTGRYEEAMLTEEALYLTYQTDSGRERRSVVQSVYDTESNSMRSLNDPR